MRFEIIQNTIDLGAQELRYRFMELPEEACDTIVPVIEIGNNAKEIQLEIELFFNALLKIKFFYSLGKIIGSSTRFILSLIEQIFDA